MSPALRAVAALGLLVSGYVHLDLAATYDGIGESVTTGDLFRVQGTVAVLAAAAVLLLRRRWWSTALAAAVALASLTAVVLSVYVRVPAVGPLPELYEPVWYDDKVVSAVAAGVAAAAAAALLVTYRRP
ncbi:MAG: hypothetical protein JWN08_1659 [Frankiales bacterium]|nr:hypothetical protein [Frankiales bacterium]